MSYIPKPSDLARAWVNCKDQKALEEAFASAMRFARDAALDWAVENTEACYDEDGYPDVNFGTIISGKTSSDLKID